MSTRITVDQVRHVAKLARLKDFIATGSSFQIVGPKVYFEISMVGTTPTSMMLEVLGTPSAVDQNDLVLADQEAAEVLIHHLEGADLFGIDLDQLLKTAKDLQRGLNNSLMSSNTDICDLFHIVYDNEKIELHFFIQKDYIQKQF
ncbi:MAG: hypothetical protein EHM20_16810 [Alphaproteobacteria bacterium]|nr:MAG: hypothetical protein EHM20_16810 [Alphaproteobacteria bacterium]